MILRTIVEFAPDAISGPIPALFPYLSESDRDDIRNTIEAIVHRGVATRSINLDGRPYRETDIDILANTLVSVFRGNMRWRDFRVTVRAEPVTPAATGTALDRRFNFIVRVSRMPLHRAGPADVGHPVAGRDGPLAQGVIGESEMFRLADAVGREGAFVHAASITMNGLGLGFELKFRDEATALDCLARTHGQLMNESEAKSYRQIARSMSLAELSERCDSVDRAIAGLMERFQILEQERNRAAAEESARRQEAGDGT